MVRVNSAAAMEMRPPDSEGRTTRVMTFDVVRGIAMLLMLVSHSSWWLDDLDYGVAFGWDNMIVPQLSLPDSLPGFLLQLATPAFFLLGGVGLALFSEARRRRGWSERRISRFLVVRGVVLITLDVTVMNVMWNEPYYSTHLSVLTGMGICVCLMAGLRYLSKRALVVVLVVTLVSTQWYYYSLTASGSWPQEESLIRAALLAPSVEDLTWKTQFPALAWLPIVLLGFVSARPLGDGSKLALRLGLGCLAVFAVNLLAGDVGGLYPADPFIFGKHPPDVGYLSLYTGLTLLLIAGMGMQQGWQQTRTAQTVAMLGQTALFFYVIHIRLIEMVSPLIAPLEMTALERSVLIVLVVLPMLLMLCRVYRSLKRQYPESVLQYL